MQRAFRLRRAEHLAALEERIDKLESENTQLRALLELPETEWGRIGSGPTGKGKSLSEGGVPMIERVRARKEARLLDRRAKGLPDVDSSETSDRGGRDSITLSPQDSYRTNLPSDHQSQPLFKHPPSEDASAPFNYQLAMPFQLPASPGPRFPDYSTNLDSALFHKMGSNLGSTPHYGGLFNMFETPNTAEINSGESSSDQTPISPSFNQPPKSAPVLVTASAANPPDLLTRLKACCRLSDSHVVNDPGLLIFATRLCQSFPCSYNGAHPEAAPTSDSEYLLLEDSWKALKRLLDPGGEADGENRINTGRMAAELVCRAAQSRGPGGWIVCRSREGMSVKGSLVHGLIQGFGGKSA